MPEKEVNLLGGEQPVQPNKPIPIKDESSPKEQQHMVHTAKPDFSNELNPTTSPSDIISFLANKSTDELIPWEEIQLPSLGIYYGGLIPDGKVQIRPMTIYTEKILATARLAQTNQSIDYVYKNCIKFPSPFDPLDLLNGDRMFLLFYIRGVTYGNNYEFMITCTSDTCKQQSTHEYDLNMIAGTIRAPKHPTEPIRINLPYSSEITKREVWVDVRFLRGRDMQVINQRKAIRDKAIGAPVRNAKTGASSPIESVVLDDAIEANLNLVVVSANGLKDRNILSQFISKLHGVDTAAIRKCLNDEAPGIDMDVVVTCPHCQNEMRMPLPFTDSFFRPTLRGGM
jgi:hypothetical protein